MKATANERVRRVWRVLVAAGAISLFFVPLPRSSRAVGGLCPIPGNEPDTSAAPVSFEASLASPYKFEFDTGFKPSGLAIKLKAFFYASGGEIDVRAEGEMLATWDPEQAYPGNDLDVTISERGIQVQSRWQSDGGLRFGARYKYNIDYGFSTFKGEDYVPKVPHFDMSWPCDTPFTPFALSSPQTTCVKTWGRGSLPCFLELGTIPSACNDPRNLSPEVSFDFCVPLDPDAEPDTTVLGVSDFCLVIRPYAGIEIQLCGDLGLCTTIGLDGQSIEDSLSGDTIVSDGGSYVTTVTIPCDFSHPTSGSRIFNFTRGPFTFDGDAVFNLVGKLEPVIVLCLAEFLEATVNVGAAMCASLVPNPLLSGALNLPFNKMDATFSVPLRDPEVCLITPSSGTVSAAETTQVVWSTSWGAPDKCNCKAEVWYRSRLPATSIWSDSTQIYDSDNTGCINWEPLDKITGLCRDAQIKVIFKDSEGEFLAEQYGGIFRIVAGIPTVSIGGVSPGQRVCVGRTLPIAWAVQDSCNISSSIQSTARLDGNPVDFGPTIIPGQPVHLTISTAWPDSGSGWLLPLDLPNLEATFTISATEGSQTRVATSSPFIVVNPAAISAEPELVVMGAGSVPFDIGLFNGSTLIDSCGLPFDGQVTFEYRAGGPVPIGTLNPVDTQEGTHPVPPLTPGVFDPLNFHFTLDVDTEPPPGQVDTLVTTYVVSQGVLSGAMANTQKTAPGRNRTAATVGIATHRLEIRSVAVARQLEINHDIEQAGIVQEWGSNPGFEDTLWIADWSFDVGSPCNDNGWSSGPTGTFARLFEHITDNDVCSENTTCAWLWTDNIMPTIACDPRDDYGPGNFVLQPGIDEAILSPWVSLTSLPGGSGTSLSYRAFPGNLFAGRWFMALNWSARSKVRLENTDTPAPGDSFDAVTSWSRGEWTSLSLWSWITRVEDLSDQIDPGAREIQVRFRVADWGPDGLGCATRGNYCRVGPGPFLDRIRIGRHGVSGPVISEGIDSRSQAQDGFATDPAPFAPEANGAYVPSTDRFGTAAFSRGGDLATCSGSPNLITGDSIHVTVTDARGAGGITSVQWCGAIVGGPHAGKAPPPYTVGPNGFFCVPADSARLANGQIVENSWFVDLDDDYFRGGDRLFYFWAAEDVLGGFGSDPQGLSAMPLSITQAETATDGLHEVSFLPAINWDPSYLARIAADPHGKLEPTQMELAWSEQRNCILYVQMVNSRRRTTDVHRTAFMYALDRLGYRGSYDVYDMQGYGNTNNHLGGRATVVQCTGYSIIIQDAARRRTATLPEGTDLDSEKIDQCSWYRSWLAQAPVSEAGMVTLWIVGENVAEDKAGSCTLVGTEMGAALASSDVGLDLALQPLVEGQAAFTFSNGNTANFASDLFCMAGGCEIRSDYDGLAAAGTGVTTHRYKHPRSGILGDAAIVMNANAAQDYNTILQSHPWSRICNTNGGSGTPAGSDLIAKVFDAVLPLQCQEPVDPVDADGDDGTEHVPTRTMLYQSKPNPSNPTVTIRFDLADEGHVLLRIHDVAGRHVRTLMDGGLPRGTHSVVWNGLDNDGRWAASGVYYYTLKTSGFTATHKLVLMK